MDVPLCSSCPMLALHCRRRETSKHLHKDGNCYHQQRTQEDNHNFHSSFCPSSYRHQPLGGFLHSLFVIVSHSPPLPLDFQVTPDFPDTMLTPSSRVLWPCHWLRALRVRENQPERYRQFCRRAHQTRPGLNLDMAFDTMMPSSCYRVGKKKGRLRHQWTRTEDLSRVRRPVLSEMTGLSENSENNDETGSNTFAFGTVTVSWRRSEKRPTVEHICR